MEKDREYNIIEDTKQVIKLSGITVLITAMLAGGGIAVHDAFINHTEEICPLVSILSTPVKLPSGEIEGFTYGVMHQMTQIEKKYQAEGIRAIPCYDRNYQEPTDIISKVKASITTLSDGSISYTIPEGYELQLIDGEYYGIKVERRMGDTSPVIITNFLDENNNYVGEARILRLDEGK